jgi:hypothetical protein
VTSLGVPPLWLEVGQQVAFQLAPPPPGASFVVLVYDVGHTPALSGAGTTKDWILLPVQPVEVLYDTNDPEAAIDIDGLQGSASVKAASVKSAGSVGFLNLQSTQPGMPWDAVVALSPAAPLGAGALATPGGQILNLDLLSPAFFFLNGGPSALLQPFPGNFTLPFATPSPPFTLSLQMFILSTSHPDGLVLSQPSQLDSFMSLAGP